MEKTSTYAVPVGMAYCFNLMMGAGQLALPKAFVQGGWVLGLSGITLLAFMSYSTVTFIIEAHSVHNALRRYDGSKKRKTEIEKHELIEKTESVPHDANGNSYNNGNKNNNNNIIKNINKNQINNNNKGNDNNNNNSDSNNKYDSNNSVEPLHTYEITMKTELGELCNIFLNKFGYFVFYIAFCLYLYGSSSIYAAAVSKSLASIVCKDQESFHAGNHSVPCKTFPQITLMQTYRISLAVFTLLCCPFAFCKLTSTKVLQVSTMAFRCLALLAMVILALLKMGKEGAVSHPQIADFRKLPDFISTAICAFMCQYSIPSVVTPIRNKKNLRIAVFLDFCLVLLFCACLTMTAVYAFDVDQVQDLYTLTFQHPLGMRYILQLFPILTLGANFPVIAVVLRDNIKKFFLVRNEEEYGVFLRRVLFPLVAVIPPVVVSYCTYDVGMLVGYTGVYFGAIIQYLIPVFLVHSARRKARETFGTYDNRYASPLSGVGWLVLVLAWYVMTFVFVTYSKLNNLHDAEEQLRIFSGSKKSV